MDEPKQVDRPKKNSAKQKEKSKLSGFILQMKI